MVCVSSHRKHTLAIPRTTTLYGMFGRMEVGRLLPVICSNKIDVKALFKSMVGGVWSAI